MSISGEEFFNEYASTQFSCQNKPRTIQYFFHGNQNNTINLDPSYQRGEVWCNTGKIDLINSLLHGISLPPIILNQHGKSQQFDVIDGKQRLTTIIGFMKNEFPIELNSTKIYFSKIPSDMTSNCKIFDSNFQENFKNTEVSTTIYESLSEKEQRTIFEKINYGTPLKDGEKLKGSNSKGIYLLEKLIDKYNHKLFQIGIKNERDSYYLKVGAIIALACKDYKFASSGKPILDYFKSWNKNQTDEDLIYNKISDLLDELYSLHINLEKYHNSRTSSKFKKMNFCDVLFNVYYLNNYQDKWAILCQFNKFWYHWRNNTRNIRDIQDNYEFSKICEEWESLGRKNTNKLDIYERKTEIVDIILKKYIDKSVPKSIKEQIVHKYFRTNNKHIICICCKNTIKSQICPNNFHCGHIISKNNGGIMHITNLRPICINCNSTMGTKDMDIYNPECLNVY